MTFIVDISSQGHLFLVGKSRFENVLKGAWDEVSPPGAPPMKR